MRSFILYLLLCVGCGGTRDVPPEPRVPPYGPANYTVTIGVTNETPDFVPVWMRVTVDGATVTERGARPQPGPEIESAAPIALGSCLHRARVAAGTHEIGVELVSRGEGRGVFSYLRRYAFEVDSTTRVDVPENVFGVEVTSVFYGHGDATTPIEERPAIRWHQNLQRETPREHCGGETPLM